MKRFCWPPILENLIGDSGVSLVIHSSARDYSSAEYLSLQLGQLGKYVIGAVPTRVPRWDAICHWLELHPEVTDYCIPDDSPNEFPPGLEKLIICNPRTGISDTGVQQAIALWLKNA
jgi:hypothetical protein